MNKSKGELAFDAVIGLILVVVIILTLYPVLYIVFASFSDPMRFMQYRGLLLRPIGFSTEVYRLVFNFPMIVKGYINTLYILFFGVILNMILTIFGAYALSRKKVLFGNMIMLFILFSMFFKGGMIPFYLVVNELGLNNSRWSVILPFMVNTFNLIIMRTYFAGIPDSMEESGRIDGANDFTILLKIFLPLCKPVIAVILLYYAVGHWNGWFWASCFISKRDLLPLQVILREILLQNDVAQMTGGGGADTAFVSYTLKYATVVVAMAPIMIIYPFLQKYFEKGVMIGAVKG